MGSGGVELGTFAMLMEPLGKPGGEEYGPVIPGPEMKTQTHHYIQNLSKLSIHQIQKHN